MCGNCGCGTRKPSKYATFIKDHTHDHGSSDHYHDPETGEAVFYGEHGSHAHGHSHAHEHSHEHAQ